MATAQCCDATGYYGPSVYLDDGGKNVNASPEFYWELEAKRLAQGFTPAEKRVAAPPSKAQSETDGAVDDSKSQMTADFEVKDFAAALREGRIKPENPEKATE
jgi:hypothetical protein